MPRRGALNLIACAIAVTPSGATPCQSYTVALSDEALAIIDWLIAAGYHTNIDEVVRAAIEAMMLREGKTLGLDW